MNLLVFVTVIMFILGILSYERLQNFFEFTIVRKEWTNLIAEQEREELDNRVLNAYDEIHVKEGKHDAEPAVKANSKINVRWLTILENRKTEKGKASLEILGNLISLLFKEYPFYEKAEKERSNFIAEILQGLENPKDVYGRAITIKSHTDLATMMWPDNQIREIFHEMIKYSAVPPENKNEEKTVEIDSLFNYLTAQNNTPEIRIYLASQNLLTVIFESVQTANEVISFREKLYKEVDSKGREIAKQEFEGMFKSRIRGEWQHLMNFEVSKTNPKAYR